MIYYNAELDEETLLLIRLGYHAQFLTSHLISNIMKKCLITYFPFTYFVYNVPQNMYHVLHIKSILTVLGKASNSLRKRSIPKLFSRELAMIYVIHQKGYIAYNTSYSTLFELILYMLAPITCKHLGLTYTSQVLHSTIPSHVNEPNLGLSISTFPLFHA